MEKPETGEWKCPQGRFHRNEARLRYGSTVKDCEKVLYRFQGSWNFILKIMWGFSSAGRAPALQAGGQRFDPANLHHMGR